MLQNDMLPPRSSVPKVPRNQWYVAAGSTELGEELLARKLLGKPILLYRTADGTPVALDDRCPHRAMPLSMGRRIGDEIQCAYHGFRFAASGRCTHIPSSPTVPGAMRVTAYPLAELFGFVWIWMGDPALADTALLPRDHAYITPTHHGRFFFCYPMGGNYLRLHENLMDTSHPSYLHEGMFDSSDLAAAPYKVETGDNMVRLSRDVGPHVPNDSTAFAFNLRPGERVTRTLITETHPPCLNIIVNRFTYVDKPEEPPVVAINIHGVVPADEHNCYQFAGVYTPEPLPDEEAAKTFLADVLEQDSVALGAIESACTVDDPEQADEISIRADEASIRLRRMILKMAREEQERVPAAATA